MLDQHCWFSSTEVGATNLVVVAKGGRGLQSSILPAQYCDAQIHLRHHHTILSMNWPNLGGWNWTLEGIIRVWTLSTRQKITLFLKKNVHIEKSTQFKCQGMGYFSTAVSRLRVCSSYGDLQKGGRRPIQLWWTSSGGQKTSTHQASLPWYFSILIYAALLKCNFLMNWRIFCV